MSNTAGELLGFIRRVARRRAVLAAANGAAAGMLAGIVAGVVSGAVASWGLQARVIGLGIAGLLVGAVLGSLLRRRNDLAEIERRAAGSRNVVLTAAELLKSPGHAQSNVVELVVDHAAAAIRPLEPAGLFPARRSLTALAGAVAIWVATIGLTAAVDPRAPITLGAAAPPDEVGTVQVTVVPPAYSKRPTASLTDPARIEALAGSEISVRVRGRDVRVETLEGNVAAVDGVHRFTAQADGFVAIHAGRSARKLIGLTVTPDQVPRVRVTAPGKDMFLADARRRIPVAIEARDDIALTTLKLRYTKVSGSGERFTFEEGELPIAISRDNDREWTARATLDLAALALEQGDMVVYRGAAADARPGAPLAESDAFIVEITSPLSIAAEGFSLDDQQEKYALSQQMVILKTERLLARASSLSPDSLAYYSQNIAAEQRAVRAEFVFMMGGEVAEEVIAAAGMDIDESKEAENEAEIAAGRMVNRGRVALVDAIRLMSRASTQLNNVDPHAALPVEREALVALQQAFSRTRYLLRALTQRERLDLSRRLTGVLTLAARDAQPQPVASPDAAIVALRRALADIATLAASGADRVEASRIAQQVLAVDASDSTLQVVAARLSESKPDDAAVALTQALRNRMPREDATTEPAEVRRLRGALNDALRAGGRP